MESEDKEAKDNGNQKICAAAVDHQALRRSKKDLCELTRG